MFLGDPPDNEYQRGFLGAMLIVAEEALGLNEGNIPLRGSTKVDTRSREVGSPRPSAMYEGTRKNAMKTRERPFEKGNPGTPAHKADHYAKVPTLHLSFNRPIGPTQEHDHD